MMPKFLRFKACGAACIQIDIPSIQGISVQFNEEREVFVLTIFTGGDFYEVYSGTFDQCHYFLNKINNAISPEIVDIK